MKMRKILSFVLVLSLVLGSFSMAFAATPAAGLSDIAGSANEEAIQVAYDLGIVTGNPDGTYLPEKAVNSAEFAAMITRAMAIPESALAGYTATKFKDMSGYGWATGYIAFCESKGIMLGDGQGNAMPGRTITVNEAMTMVLRAVGYTNNSAALVGAWPANYVTLAQNLSLYDDVAATTTIDKANAAQIIYNALSVDKVEVASDGKTEVLAGKSLLTTGLGAKEELPAVITGTENSSINLKAFVGDYAVRITKSGKVISVKEVKSKALEGSINKAGSIDTNIAASYGAISGVKFVLTDDTEYTFASGLVVKDYVAFENGAATGAAVITSDDAVTLNVKLDGKVIKEVYSVEQWSETKADQADASTLSEITQNDRLLGEEFALLDKEIDLTSFELVGVKSLSDIKVDNIVYVYTNPDTDKIAKVAVGTEVVEGVVSEFDTDESEFVIGGKTYANAAPAAGDASGKDVAATNVTDTVKAFLDAYGDVYTFEVVKSSPDLYGVVLATASGIDTQVKLFTSEDATKVYTVKSTASLVASAQALTIDQIVKFTVDKDGKINSIALTTANASPVTITALSNTVISGDLGSLVVKDGAFVFTKSGSTYDVKTMADLVKKTSIVGAKVFKGTEKVEAFLVPAGQANASADDVYGVINKKVDAANADNDPVFKLTGFKDATAFTALTDDDVPANYADAPAKNWNIDNANLAIYKIEFNADGVVVKAITKGEVAATGTALTSAKTYITTSEGAVIPVKDSTVYYEYVKADGEYKVFYGSVLENYTVKAYNTDKDDAACEYVIVIRN